MSDYLTNLINRSFDGVPAREPIIGPRLDYPFDAKTGASDFSEDAVEVESATIESLTDRRNSAAARFPLLTSPRPKQRPSFSQDKEMSNPTPTPPTPKSKPGAHELIDESAPRNESRNEMEPRPVHSRSNGKAAARTDELIKAKDESSMRGSQTRFDAQSRSPQALALAEQGEIVQRESLPEGLIDSEAQKSAPVSSVIKTQTVQIETRIRPLVVEPLFDFKSKEPPPETVVNVSIGRVEVRATQATQAAQSTTRRPAAPAMNLDDYLRKRQGGSS